MFANTLQLCNCRRMRCANGATGWTRVRLKLTCARISTPPPAPSVALVLRNRPPKAACAANDVPQAPAIPARRFFSDEDKLAIVRETEQPAVTVSGIARKHGIVTGLLFRWRVAFGVAQKKCARLASVALADDKAAARVLRDLVQPPEGMMAGDLPDGRRVFAIRSPTTRTKPGLIPTTRNYDPVGIPKSVKL